MHSTTLSLSALAALLGALHGTLALPASSASPTGTAPSQATMTVTVTAVPIVLPPNLPLSALPVAQNSSLLSGPESTTTLGEPLQATRSPVLPESTTTLGEPVQATRSPALPESTTTLGEPVQATRSPILPTPTAINGTCSALNTAVPEANENFGSHYGWIGAFSNDNCDGDPIADRERPKLNDQACRQITPINGTEDIKIGVYWGSWPLNFEKLGLFKDGECKDLLREISNGDEKGGPRACLGVEGVVGSVQNLDAQS